MISNFARLLACTVVFVFISFVVGIDKMLHMIVLSCCMLYTYAFANYACLLGSGYKLQVTNVSFLLSTLRICFLLHCQVRSICSLFLSLFPVSLSSQSTNR